MHRCIFPIFRKGFSGSAQFRQLNRLFNRCEHFKLRSCLHQIRCDDRVIRRSLSRPQERKLWAGWLASCFIHTALDPIEYNEGDTFINSNPMYDIITQWQPIIEHHFHSEIDLKCETCDNELIRRYCYLLNWISCQSRRIPCFCFLITGVWSQGNPQVLHGR